MITRLSNRLMPTKLQIYAHLIAATFCLISCSSPHMLPTLLSQVQQTGFVAVPEAELYSSVRASPFSFDIDGSSFDEIWPALLHVIAERAVIVKVDISQGVVVALAGPLEVPEGLGDELVATQTPHVAQLSCNRASSRCAIRLAWWDALSNPSGADGLRRQAGTVSKLTLARQLLSELVVYTYWPKKWAYLAENR